MAGLGKSAAPPKFQCRSREGSLRERKLHLHKAGLSRSADLDGDRSERQL